MGLVGAAITLLLRAGHTDGLVPRVQDYVHVRAGRCGEGVPTITSPVMTGSSEAAWQVCWGQELPVFLRKWEEHRLVHQSEHTGWHWGLWEEQAWEPEWRGRAGGGGPACHMAAVTPDRFLPCEAPVSHVWAMSGSEASWLLPAELRGRSISGGISGARSPRAILLPSVTALPTLGGTHCRVHCVDLAVSGSPAEGTHSSCENQVRFPALRALRGK